MLTVPQAAKRARRNPETIRRWIREGKLRSQKIGTQHFIEDSELDAFIGADVLAGPPEWDVMDDGRPMPNWVSIIRADRETH